MRKYLTRVGLTGLLLAIGVVLTTLPIPTHPAIALAQADGPIFPLDTDLDGLLDPVETGGWVNERANGNPYTTDPTDADSDDDGLSDGEEMLFNTDPNIDQNPGLHTVYEDSFQTGEYWFAWTPEKRSGVYRPHGHKMIGTDTLVLRRGTTFTVGGPGSVAGFPVTLTWADAIGGGSLSPLNVSNRNACGDDCNGWTVTIPLNNNSTVGKYKLVASNGQGWTEELIVDVIFEMPNGLTDAEVDAYLYDGDRTNLRDQTAVWIYTGTEQDKIPLKGSDFGVDQYESYIFDGQEAVRYKGGQPQDYPSAIEAVHGKKNTWDASDRLAKRADEYTCFAFPLTPRSNTWRTLFPDFVEGSGYNNQCSNIAGLSTALHRAVGIPARLVVVDHRTTNFDTSAEIWTRPNNGSYDWYTTRSFLPGTEDDGGDPLIKYCEIPRVTGGYRPRMSRSEYGRTYYKPWAGVWPKKVSAGQGDELMMIGANENWVWEHILDSAADFYWVPADKYKVSRHHWFETRVMPYWSADYQVDREPDDVADPPAKPPAWNGLGPQTVGPDAPINKVRLGQVLSEAALDDDGDGKFDRLALELLMEVAEPGRYWIQAELGKRDPQLDLTEGVMATDIVQVDLQQGQQAVQLEFDALSISRNRIDGPYTLLYLLITDVENPTLLDFVNESLDTRNDSYVTAAYKFNDFETTAAMLARKYVERAVDSDGDGYTEALEIDVALDIYQPGTYTLVGELYDSQRHQVGEATWTGNGPQATLRFEGLSRTSGPYQLRHLDLARADGQGVDAIERAYWTQLTSVGEPVTGFTAMALESGGDLGMLGVGITATTYIDTRVDTNGNGKYDNLQIQVGVQVVTPDNYKLEGWLADEQGNLVSWAQTGPVALPVGNHALTLTYDGRVLRDHMKFYQTQKFTLVALKLYTGVLRWNEIDDEVDVAYTTAEYALNQFEPAVNGWVAFEDYMENGAGQWAGGSAPWDIVQDDAYSSSSHAWWAGDAQASLDAILNLSFVLNPQLKFRTYHQLNGSGDTGYVKASTDGSNWTTLATLSDVANSWETKVVNLGAFSNQPTVYLRFELVSPGASSDYWYIDDVLVAGDYNDLDNDGLPDGWEQQYGVNNPAGDPDGDGLVNLDEFLAGTNPQDSDTDDDGMFDKWEVDYGTNPRLDDAGADPDLDGLANLQESQYLTNPHDDDTDDDSLEDGEEVYTYQTNPKDSDSDDDGLNDGQEVNLINTNPNNPDTDLDGIPDAYEVGNPTNPRNTDNNGPIDALDTDSDNDTILDAAEWDNLCDNMGLDTDGDNIPNCQDNDADGDGLDNYRDLDSDNAQGSDKNEGDGDNDDDDIPNFLDSDPAANAHPLNNVFFPILR